MDTRQVGYRNRRTILDFKSGHYPPRSDKLRPLALLALDSKSIIEMDASSCFHPWTCNSFGCGHFALVEGSVEKPHPSEEGEALRKTREPESSTGMFPCPDGQSDALHASNEPGACVYWMCRARKRLWAGRDVSQLRSRMPQSTRCVRVFIAICRAAPLIVDGAVGPHSIRSPRRHGRHCGEEEE